MPDSFSWNEYFAKRRPRKGLLNLKINLDLLTRLTYLETESKQWMSIVRRLCNSLHVSWLKHVLSQRNKDITSKNNTRDQEWIINWLTLLKLNINNKDGS